MQTITELEKEFIKSLEIILNNIDNEKIDETLDNRDDEVFSDAWTSAYGQTKNNTIKPELRTEINRIRKEIFMLVYQKTNSSDLSAYISDDFELIAFHLLDNTSNIWVSDLHRWYVKNEIPPRVS